MKIVNNEEAQTLAKQDPGKPVKLAASAIFENRAQLIKALENLNYRVERDVKVKGKSGTDYSFDIVAYEDDAVTAHKLVIDFMNAEGGISSWIRFHFLK